MASCPAYLLSGVRIFSNSARNEKKDVNLTTEIVLNVSK